MEVTVNQLLQLYNFFDVEVELKDNYSTDTYFKGHAREIIEEDKNKKITYFYAENNDKEYVYANKIIIYTRN